MSVPTLLSLSLQKAYQSIPQVSHNNVTKDLPDPVTFELLKIDLFSGVWAQEFGPYDMMSIKYDGMAWTFATSVACQGCDMVWLRRAPVTVKEGTLIPPPYHYLFPFGIWTEDRMRAFFAVAGFPPVMLTVSLRWILFPF